MTMNTSIGNTLDSYLLDVKQIVATAQSIGSTAPAAPTPAPAPAPAAQTSPAGGWGMGSIGLAAVAVIVGVLIIKKLT